MPVDRHVPWPRTDHTAAKHDIYRRYFERWFPILLGGSNPYRSATYAEGFAGPGIYTGNEPGSPIIAMRAFLDKVSNQQAVVRFVFVDDDKRCIKMLREQLTAVFPARPRPKDKMPVKVEHGTCADKLERCLDKMGAWGHPILAVLDSWGNAPIPPALLRRIAHNPASEVIVTFGPQHFLRFVSQLDSATDDVFGGDPSWRRIEQMNDPTAKKQHLLSCYRASLKAAGFAHLLDFELVDRRGEKLYLVFGTNHHLGVQKMKDSLWEVDPVFGVGFADPRDEQHEALFELTEPQLSPLRRLLLTRIQQAPPTGIRVEDLRDFTLDETVFRPQHVISALTPMRDSGAIIADTPGAIRRATFVRTPQP
jgi:three-Cys-motif partner protein